MSLTQSECKDEQVMLRVRIKTSRYTDERYVNLLSYDLF